MDDVRVGSQQVQNIVFFQEASVRAIEYRLSLVKQEAGNHQVMEHELPNLWEAVRQSYEQKTWEVVMAFRDALQPFLDLRGYWARSLTLNKWAREAAQALGDPVSVARWTHDAADMLQQRGEYQEAEGLYRTSEDAYRSLGENEMALKSRHMRSLVVRAQGRLDEARHLSDTTVREAEKLGLDQWLAHPLYVRGLLARDRGDFREARRSVEESLSLLANTEELAMIAQCQHFLGELALLSGDIAEARSQLEASVQLSQQVGILRRVAATQRLLGDLARMEGRYDEAEGTYREALEIVTDIGDKPQLARLLLSKARLAIQREQVEDEVELLAGSRSHLSRNWGCQRSGWSLTASGSLLSTTKAVAADVADGLERAKDCLVGRPATSSNCAWGVTSQARVSRSLTHSIEEVIIGCVVSTLQRERAGLSGRIPAPGDPDGPDSGHRPMGRSLRSGPRRVAVVTLLASAARSQGVEPD